MDREIWRRARNGKFFGEREKWLREDGLFKSTCRRFVIRGIREYRRARLGRLRIIYKHVRTHIWVHTYMGRKRDQPNGYCEIRAAALRSFNQECTIRCAGICLREDAHIWTKSFSMNFSEFRRDGINIIIKFNQLDLEFRERAHSSEEN